MERQNIKLRLLKLALFISYLFCYLEWPNNQGFIFQLETEIITKNGNVESMMHPFILIPLIGQLLLGISILLNGKNRKLTLTALGMLGVLVLMIFLVGMLSQNVKIISSVLPFLFLSFIYFRFTKTPA